VIIEENAMRHPAIARRLPVLLLVVAALSRPMLAQLPSPSGSSSKLDPLLEERLSDLTGRSHIIARAVDAASLPLVATIIEQAGGALVRPLPIIDAYAAEVPHASLPILAGSSLIQRLSLNRVAVAALETTNSTVGATDARKAFGYDGAGVGIAVIDSGIASWHDDLSEGRGAIQRVDEFVDFVNQRAAQYDDYGHGTHVAGIIAGNGFDSDGARSGIAPAARLIVLKALDASGRGRISDVIAALGYVVGHKDRLNIRVVNLSIATGVYESFNLDPLTLAAKRAVGAGIVVVAAAGNNGRSPQGREHYGGITAPGNAPWVVTVGASSHMGTRARTDDTIAAFSSRGPAAIDDAAKPDVVAPGVGIESLSDPHSAFYRSKSPYLLEGTVATSYLPYLSLSGTSMATPVVSGTIALMLQANPALTPNQAKAILQYTAQTYRAYNPLMQGTGFLNAKGAVELARFFAAPAGTPYPRSGEWASRIIWGNQLIGGGRLTADANAWSTGVTWGAATLAGGQNVEWGVICSAARCDLEGGTWNRWGTTCSDSTCSDVTWGSGSSENVVWGSNCGGEDCGGTWRIGVTGYVVSDGVEGAAVVWGTTDAEGRAWGTSCTDASCTPVIWND
jgi:serine protease AprX